MFTNVFSFYFLLLLGKASEPTITTKKKIHEPKPTSTTKFEVDADDYMLLGNNDKFAANVKYRSKSRDRVSFFVFLMRKINY